MDLSIDPKLRCRPEHVGRALPYSGVSGQRIYGVTTASLILHSLVVFANDQPATCGTIVPFFLPSSSASTEFKLGVCGRVYIFQWPGECIIYLGTCTSMCMTALRIDIVVHALLKIWSKIHSKCFSLQRHHHHNFILQQEMLHLQYCSFSCRS